MLGISSLNSTVGDLQRDYLFKTIVVKRPLALANYSIPSILTKAGAQVTSPDGLSGMLPDSPGIAVGANTPEDDGTLDLLLTKGIFPERVTQQIEEYWGGEKVYYAGRDESNKKGTLVFRCPESMGIKDFFEACKDLTGTMGNHASVPKINAVMDLDVYMVSTTKNQVTEYRGLKDVQVWSVKDINPDKTGSGILTFSVDITWDAQTRDYSKRGMAI